MIFDLSAFTSIGSWIFELSTNLYQSMILDFGDFQINGLALLIGVALFCIVCYIVERVVS